MPCFTLSINLLIFSWSFCPSVSTPLDTSTAKGVKCWIASFTLSSLSPPAMKKGWDSSVVSSCPQSRSGHFLPQVHQRVDNLPENWVHAHPRLLEQPEYLHKANSQTNHPPPEHEFELNPSRPFQSLLVIPLDLVKQIRQPFYICRNDLSQLCCLVQGHLSFTRCEDKTDVVCSCWYGCFHRFFGR